MITGFILNFAFIIWEKWRIPEQRPQSLLEVFVMSLMFLVGVPLWPVAWWVRIQDVVKRKE